MRAAFHIANQRLEVVQELVEFPGDQRHFIAAGHWQLAGQVAFSAVDVCQRFLELIQRAEQPPDQQPQHQQAEQHAQAGTDDGSPGQGMGGGHDDVLIQHYADVPVHAPEIGEGDEGHQQGLSIAADFLKPAVERKGVSSEKLTVGLAVQFSVRVGNDVAAFTQQKCITGPAEIQGIDGVGYRSQADVTAKHPEQLTRIADPGNRRDQDFTRGGVLVGFGQHSLAACLAGRVPRAGATVIIGFRIP
ncbi:hypothetical protein D3C81_1246600 [compost metagenome]